MSRVLDQDPDRPASVRDQALARVLGNLGKRHTGLRVMRPNNVGTVRILCDQDASWRLTEQGRLMPEPRSARR